MEVEKVEKSFFFLENLKKEQAEQLKLQEKGNRDKEPNLLNLSNSLTDFFVLEQLKIYCAYLSYTLMINKKGIEYKASDIIQVLALERILNSRTDWHLIILIYRQLVQLFQQLKAKEYNSAFAMQDFLALETLLERPVLTKDNAITIAAYNTIDAIQWIKIYANVTNYTIYQVNKEHNEFIIKNIHYNLKRLEIEAKLEPSFIIDAGLYKNMVLLILRLRENKNRKLYTPYFPKGIHNLQGWAYHFVEQYRSHLLPTKQEYYHYCKAFIDFCTQQFGAAYATIKDLKTIREMFLSLDMKVLQLQLYMELELSKNTTLYAELDTYKEMDAFRQMLYYDKKKKPRLTYHLAYYEEFYRLYRSFFKFFERYYGRYTRGNKKYQKERMELIADINESDFLNKGWFLDKIKAI